MKLDISGSTKAKLIVAASVSFSIFSGSQLALNYARNVEPSSVTYDKYYSSYSNSSVIRLSDGENEYFIDEEQFDSLLDTASAGDSCVIDGKHFGKEEVEQAVVYHDFVLDKRNKIFTWFPFTLGSINVSSILVFAFWNFTRKSKDKELVK